MRSWRRALLALPLLLGALPASALDIPPVPQPGARWGYVSDFSGTLTESQRDALEAKLKALDASDSTQVAVVLLKSLEGDSLEGFANRLFKTWGIGQKGRNNGVLFLVALDDRKMRIEVGYGLEATLTDAVSGMIIRNDVAPCFKRGDYAGGVNAGVDAIVTVVRGEYGGMTASQYNNGDAAAILILFLFLGFALLVLYSAWRARQDSTTTGRRRRSSAWSFHLGGISLGGFSSGGGGSGFGGFSGGSSGGGGASGGW